MDLECQAARPEDDATAWHARICVVSICWFAKCVCFDYTAPATRRPVMFWMRKNKEDHRYYLLPGMGRSNRRRHQQFVRWAVVVGILASVLFAYLLYLLSQSH